MIWDLREKKKEKLFTKHKISRRNQCLVCVVSTALFAQTNIEEEARGQVLHGDNTYEENHEAE